MGALNTLKVLVLGIVLTLILGLSSGSPKFSTNWLVARMAVYLFFSRSTSAFMNWYNKKVALVER